MPPRKLKPQVAVSLDDSEMDSDSDFSAIEETTPDKILNSLLDEDNVAMKTEIAKPLTLTRFEALAKWCKDEKMHKCTKTLLDFVFNFRRNMVSYNRQSRKEIISALTESFKEERRLTDKLMSAPSGEKT
jgi:hypothetical protein